jgi:hypothetical protein
MNTASKSKGTKNFWSQPTGFMRTCMADVATRDRDRQRETASSASRPQDGALHQEALIEKSDRRM